MTHIRTSTKYPSSPTTSTLEKSQLSTPSEEDDGGKIPARDAKSHTKHASSPRIPRNLGKHRSIGLIIPLHRATPAAVILAQCPIAAPKSLLDTAWQDHTARQPRVGSRAGGRSAEKRARYSPIERNGPCHWRRGREGTLVPRSLTVEEWSPLFFCVQAQSCGHLLVQNKARLSPFQQSISSFNITHALPMPPVCVARFITVIFQSEIPLYSSTNVTFALHCIAITGLCLLSGSELVWKISLVVLN